MGGVNIGGEVERVDGRSLTYADFVSRYMKPNLPVVLTGLTDTWQSCRDWVHSDECKPDLSLFSACFSSSVVQVADCDKKEYTDQKRIEMTVGDFIKNWLQNSSNNNNINSKSSKSENHKDSLLYLKDWHFVKEYPEYCAYKTPVLFSDDWLNLYLDSHTLHRDSDICPDKNEANCADYRFVYMGQKGTWTPLHADVFRSYSWSANICGRKLWLFLPPSQTTLLFDRIGKSSVYNIYDDISETQFPGFRKTVWLECTQERGEIIFVPSGWYHQVHNLEDTISINHNWFNGYNLSWVWKLLLEDYKVAKEYIEDIRDICDEYEFESLCQRNLAANTGMNFYDFFIFITRFTLANLVELYHMRNYQNAPHFIYNLTSIREVTSKMKSEEAFNAQNVSFLSLANRSAFSDIKKIFQEKNFRELCLSLVRAYEYINGEEGQDLEIKNKCKMGCVSVNCSRDDCGVVDCVTGFVSEICGPEDLVDLVGRFLESSM